MEIIGIPYRPYSDHALTAAPLLLALKSQLLPLTFPSLHFEPNHRSQTPSNHLPRSLPPQHLQAFSRATGITAPENGTPWMQLYYLFDGKFIDVGAWDEIFGVDDTGYCVADVAPTLGGVVSVCGKGVRGT